MRERLRRRSGGMVVDAFFNGLSRAGRLHPRAAPHRHDVELISDVPYRETGLTEHLLDIYRPTSIPGPWPVVLYIHGGGFRILSKDTHWVMGLAFARRGYLVFNINYRLAPKYPFPAAVKDAAAALLWLKDNASRYGGDVSRLVYAGESAGGNLATVLTLMGCYERPEPWAQKVFAADPRPRVAMPFCAMLQVSDVERIHREKGLSRFVRDRLEEIERAYLPAHVQGDKELADPLLILESDAEPARPLPPFFAPVGTKDPLIYDTRRLRTALDAMEVPCRDLYYPGELHAFHAQVWRRNARKCWHDAFAFLNEHMPPSPSGRSKKKTE